MRAKIVAAVLLFSMAAAGVSAGHTGGAIRVERCYEVGQPTEGGISQSEPVGATCDGSVDAAVPISVPVPDKAVGDTVQVGVHDDHWGRDGRVGGVLCSDIDGDGACEAGEPRKRFCGTSSAVPAIDSVLVILNDPFEQMVHCGNDHFPISGGVLDSRAGISLVFA